MGDVEKEIKEHYTKNLKAADYVVMMGNGCKMFPDMHRFPLTFLYEQLQADKFKGSKALELGSGAVVHNIALVSAFYPNIVMSDYVEDNCDELKKWLQGDSTLDQFLDIPAEIEGYGEDLETGKQLIEKRIKKTVKQVVRCDVLDDNIFMEEVKSDVASPYDFIISSLCLESSAPDFDGFILSLKRVNKILRPGGGLFLVGFFKGKPWLTGENNFHYLEIDEAEMRKALEESGFGNVDLRVHGKLEFDYDHQSYYSLMAEKIEETSLNGK